MKILFIEEQRLALKYYEHILEENGHEVTIILDIQEALSFLERDPVDIIFLEIALPSGIFSPSETRGGTETGLVLYRRELAHRFPKTQIVFFTFYEEDEIKSKLPQAENVHFWKKFDHPPRVFSAKLTELFTKK